MRQPVRKDEDAGSNPVCDEALDPVIKANLLKAIEAQIGPEDHVENGPIKIDEKQKSNDQSQESVNKVSNSKPEAFEEKKVASTINIVRDDEIKEPAKTKQKNETKQEAPKVQETQKPCEVKKSVRGPLAHVQLTQNA